MQAPAFEIRNLSVEVDSARGPLRLVHDVSLTVAQGASLGLVGESGCGKSVSLFAALGLLKGARVKGSVRLFGDEILGLPERRLEAIRGKRIGMIFQDPQASLNPVRSIGAQMVEPLRRHLGLSPAQARTRAAELLAEVGIPAPERVLRAFPHQLSGGMCQRVMIALALAPEPEVLLADEPTTALDATVQKQVLALLGRIRRGSNLALVLVSHDLGVVAHSCQDLAVMYAGRTVEWQAVPQVFDRPAHPYTRALIDCMPSLDPAAPPPRAIPGEVPRPGLPRPGCAFAARCAAVTEACRNAQPEAREIPGGAVRCLVQLPAHKTEEIPA